MTTINGSTGTCTGQWINMCDATSASQCASMNQAVAVTPKITGMLSMIGSALIIYRFFTIKPRARKTYDRLMLGMSVMNFWGSFGFFLGQWTFYSIPTGQKDSPFCSWQGWLLQINAAVYWYNAVLATNFVLRIRLGWSEERVRKWEPLMHCVAWLYPTVTSFVALGLDMYGRAGPWCWIFISYDWARWAFFFAWLWALMIYSTCCMVIIVITVKRSDDQTASIRDGHTSKGSKQQPKRLGKKTRQVAIQATLYVAAFLLTWAFGTANRIQNAIVADSPSPCNEFALVWLHSFFVPLQGFFNFIVYIFPRVKEKKTARRTRRSTSVDEKQNRVKRACLSVKEFVTQTYSVVFGGEKSETRGDSRASGSRNEANGPSAQRERLLRNAKHGDNASGQPQSAEAPSEPNGDESNSNDPLAGVAKPQKPPTASTQQDAAPMTEATTTNGTGAPEDHSQTATNGVLDEKANGAALTLQ